jgi:metallo-beta-lactamase class B
MIAGLDMGTRVVRNSVYIALATLAIGLAAAVPAEQPTEQQAAGGQVKVNDQGSQIEPAAQVHFDAADKAAGTDFPGALLLCNAARPRPLKRAMPTSDELRSVGRIPGQPIEPVRVFDNLYYIGVANVTAWAAITSKGIVVIDSLNNKGEWIKDIEPGMRKLALDPSQIKYVVVTHGHGDHFGGSAYLARTYHAHVMMSDADWTLAPSMLDKPEFEAPPPRDMVIHDGEKLTLGGETLTLYVTPGHTLGTVSVLIPVTDQGQKHVAALWGGTGFNFPHSHARFKTYSDSAQRFRRIALEAGADTPLSNHPEVDGVGKKIALLRERPPGGPNPFVMGKDSVRRFLTTVSECAQAYDAQMSATITVAPDSADAATASGAHGVEPVSPAPGTAVVRPRSRLHFLLYYGLTKLPLLLCIVAEVLANSQTR